VSKKERSSVRPVAPPTTSVATVHEAIAVLTRLTDLVRERREQLAGNVGLTEAQWGVLEEISTEHFMPSMFAKNEDRSRAAVSKVIRQLLDRGLVHVAISQNDGRQRDYALTDEGRAALARLRNERARAIDAIWMTLDQDTLERFNLFASDLVARIERHATQASSQASSPSPSRE
jgi:DNA-binding MarR family transcriptional regulator